MALLVLEDIFFSEREKGLLSSASVVPLAVPVSSCGNRPLGGTS